MCKNTLLVVLCHATYYSLVKQYRSVTVENNGVVKVLAEISLSYFITWVEYIFITVTIYLWSGSSSERATWNLLLNKSRISHLALSRSYGIAPATING